MPHPLNLKSQLHHPRTAKFSRASLFSSKYSHALLCTYHQSLCPLCLHIPPKDHQNHLLHHSPKNISLISEQVALILREIDVSQKKLAKMEKELLGYESLDLSRPNLTNELKIFFQHHQLPLGKDSRTEITEMVASVGHSCEKSVDLLSQYMSYKVYPSLFLMR